MVLNTCDEGSFPVMKRIKYYVNIPMEYTAIFHDCKNDNFHMINCDIFLMFAQNIDHGYTLEPPHGGSSKEYPQSMF